MSQLVNHSDLQNVSVINPNHQLLLRLANGLSGQAGFGRTNVQTFEKGLTVYSTVNNISATWESSVSAIASFQPTISLVQSNSANWNLAFNQTTFVGANSGRWNNSSTVTEGNSAKWNANYTTVNSNSAKWNATFTTLNSSSAFWQNYSQSVANNESLWTNTSYIVAEESPNWSSSFSQVFTNSANWEASFTIVTQSSANWDKINDPIISGKILSANDIRALIVNNSTPTFVLDAAQSSQTIICDAPNGTVISFPPNALVNIPVNTQITFISFHSTGTTIFSAGPSVVLNSFNNSLTAGGKNAAVTCLKSDVDSWFLIGNLA